MTSEYQNPILSYSMGKVRLVAKVNEYEKLTNGYCCWSLKSKPLTMNTSV